MEIMNESEKWGKGVHVQSPSPRPSAPPKHADFPTPGVI